jgi:peroxiredoxin family protein
MFGVGGRVAAEIDEEFREKGIANFESLLQASGELGVRFMVCEMGLRALDITSDDLRDDVPIEVTGAVTFLSTAPSYGPMVVV